MQQRNMKCTQSPPPWEVLDLVAHRLDPKTLAIASCVSKSWSFSMSSDHLWKPILATHFPSLSNLPTAVAVPYRRLFAIGHSAAKRRRRNPFEPNLSLSDLDFAVSISTAAESCSVVKPCDSLVVDPPGVFRFDVSGGGATVREGVEEVNITWNVILKGWRDVFTMMECKGKVGFVAGGEGWFSQELPAAPCCCSNGVASAVVADLKVGMMCGDDEKGRVRVKKVSVGILSVADWRYVGIDDGLRYLQHFLLTCN